MTLNVAVRGVGVLGPGLSDWAQARQVLGSDGTWLSAPTLVPAPQRLPANERRRAGTVVKASIVVADQALSDAGAGYNAATIATVFSSSTSDPHNCHALCEALAQPERVVSPTRFTNSVHNAPAGYWHIAVQSRAASTSIAALDASFAAGLLEAAVQCQSSQAPVLLVACDLPYPEPLHALRQITDIFAVALLLTPSDGRGLQLELQPQARPDTLAHAELERLRAGVPAARSLPLLLALLQPQASETVIPSWPGQGLRLRLAADAPS